MVLAAALRLPAARPIARLSASRPLAAKAVPLVHQKAALVGQPIVSSARAARRRPIAFAAGCRVCPGPMAGAMGPGARLQRLAGGA